MLNEGGGVDSGFFKNGILSGISLVLCNPTDTYKGSKEWIG